MKAIHPFMLFALAAALGLSTHSACAQATGNTAYGVGALASVTTGSNNTALGEAALFSNTDGEYNSASGYHALTDNVSGGYNTACGAHALGSNTEGHGNTACGGGALSYNLKGSNNAASGAFALHLNTSGNFNTACGGFALHSNDSGIYNTAAGMEALASNLTGKFNTAVGAGALAKNEKGDRNIAIGYQAGFNLTGSANIMIGHPGEPSEAATIRIGNPTVHFQTYLAGVFGTSLTRGSSVRVNSSGRLGVVPSSRRFKRDIEDMGTVSDAILSLRPVTFRYKAELDSTNSSQLGLIAEEVAEVCPDLVLHDSQGEIFTVNYDAVNAMLLNEFLKQHKRVQQQDRDLAAEQRMNAAQERVIADQKKQIEALAECVNEMRRRLDKAIPPAVDSGTRQADGNVGPGGGE